MADIAKLVSTTSAKVDSLGITNGQLVFLSDKPGAYYDLNGVRRKIVDNSVSPSTNNMYIKSVASGDWALNSETNYYEISIPATEHGCGTSAYIASVTSDNGTEHELVIYNAATNNDTGDITVACVNGEAGRIIVSGIVAASNNAYIQEVAVSDWTENTTDGCYELSIPASTHRLGENVFVLEVSVEENGSHVNQIYDSVISSSGDITVQVISAITGRVVIASATIQFTTENTDVSTEMANMLQRISDLEARVSQLGG